MADKLQDGRPKCGASLELPSGFVKTEEGEVVIPSSRRADGSMRKPIRIRQGYIPQDEIPKYKTVAQRRREQKEEAAAIDASTKSPLLSMQRSLPPGAVTTEEGDVVIPASKRPDGSMRKPIRIRKGYVPQDEVPKYKTIAQRRREEQLQEKTKTTITSSSLKNEEKILEKSMEKLSLDVTKQKDKPNTSLSPSLHVPEQIDNNTTTTAAIQKKEEQAMLKKELSKLNKMLREITKIEAKKVIQESISRPPPAPSSTFSTSTTTTTTTTTISPRKSTLKNELSNHDKRKLDRKKEIETKRQEIIKQLDS